MSSPNLKTILEALIMVSDDPISAEKLLANIADESLTVKDVKESLLELEADYQGRGVELVKVASGYRFQARTEYKQWFEKLFTEKPPKYSRALLETLAIIAYRQPVTRADVEAIRGVAVSSSIIKTLLERDWAKVVGHRDVPGKPAIYATTKAFLDYFNLEKLDDLPTLQEIKDMSELVETDELQEETAEVTLIEEVEGVDESLSPVEAFSEDIACEDSEDESDELPQETVDEVGDELDASVIEATVPKEVLETKQEASSDLEVETEIKESIDA